MAAALPLTPALSPQAGRGCREAVGEGPGLNDAELFSNGPQVNSIEARMMNVEFNIH